LGRLGPQALADSTTWTSVSGLPANTVLAGIACPNGGGLLCAAVGSTSGNTQAVILLTVKGTAAQIGDLINQVNNLHLPTGLQTSLDAKLQAALSSVNAGNTTAACNQLGVFINEVQAQAGKMLTPSQAQQLQSDATQIQTVLAC
jgi:hypothetical protein